MAEDILIREDLGSVTRLTLNMPGSLNALSDAMLARLRAEFGALVINADQRVIVLRGAGKAFCAGHDLKEISLKRQDTDKGAAAIRDLFTRCADVMQMIRRLPQPVIAQVHGMPPRLAASWSPPAIWPSPRMTPALASTASISGCSVRRRWWRSAAISRANRPLRC